MKKRMKISAIFLMCTLVLCACGSSTSNNQVAETTQSIQSTDSSTNETEAETSKNQVSDNTESGNQASETVEANSAEFENVNFGDTITTDFIEMTIESASTSQELYPTDTSGYYSYMSDQDNETYFYILGNIKNIGGDSYSVEDMNIQFTFDDKYNYSGYIAADDGGDDFYGDYVKPLATVKYYMYASVPDELINAYSTCRVQFAFKENLEDDWDSDFSEYEYCYQIDLSK